MAIRTLKPHLTHWGAFDAEVVDGQLVAIRPFEHDPNPSPVLDNIPGSLRHVTRVTQPMIRKGWLEDGPGPSDRRGADPFVAVSWDTAIELLAGELRRVYDDFGPRAVYGGSYGWASAGRFHHAQSQLHRFLNCLGGYTRSVDSYSYAAGGVIMPRVLSDVGVLHYTGTHWRSLVEHTELFVSFGGMPLKNTAVSSGGVFRHRTRDFIQQAAERGAEFVLFSPLRDDMADFANATWHPISPGTDVAVMLALAYTLITEDLHDREFLSRYCVGFDKLERYILGLDDGQPKTPEWAADISEIPAEELRALARRMAGKRVFLTTTWSLQRNEFGEQPPWMGVALAAMLGQIGLPGGGYGFGYGSAQRVGEGVVRDGLGFPALPQGRNPIDSFIPVARFADMLLKPGARFDYDGGRYSYPEIRLVYWAGGNPFHHHQHLGKLRRALGNIDTFVVHEPFWTAAARHADVVLPVTLTLERNDIGSSQNDAYLVAMQQAVEPVGEAHDDYSIFAGLAEQLGALEAFTEGLDVDGWLRRLYAQWRERAAAHGYRMPDFDQFWAEGYIDVPLDESKVLFADFRNDPEGAPLATPSGKVELFSETIAGFGYADCQGHPRWYSPTEWLGGDRTAQFPLLMIANNPKTRLHSQLDVGDYSQGSKIQGREPLRLHSRDASTRGIRDGDVVRVYNDRGSFLAGAVVSDDVRPAVVQISTGAWYDPLEPGNVDSMCVHGNPNTLTFDAGSSSLAQGSVGQHTLVEIERWDGDLPPVTVGSPPRIEAQAHSS
jgi:biotin/methionine sulfoxide reductase